MKVIVAGGTGFIGRPLVSRLRLAGHEVLVLSRSGSGRGLAEGVRVVPWAEEAVWEAEVDGAGAVINLAGENVARRWTPSAKAEIERSRVEATNRLVNAMAKAKRRPAVLVNASAVGYYGACGDQEIPEHSAPGGGFLSQTCARWEAAARVAETLGIRVVRIRIGLVLAADGGALAKMLPAFRAFAGGPVGSGAQWTSWIHRDDLVELFVFALSNPGVSGALNGTAPGPVRNREFAAALGKALHRPAFVPAPAPAVRLLFGEMATMVLEGQRIPPRRALDLGFRFRFPEIGPALRDVLGG